ncbi:hypothetical protein GIY23_15360 [Allosaccharopolyspora coralli]|uniref:SAM-dependent methyltransferase n=1 Tax=Allosaccharopolyspora coralli TaxID=2665642 RepID=A0A5Q3QA22_9PSEU|nr:SAM-dependent methyltransferase [Allosaccharopolyspora coralli]QGK70710.1 hypothetical protein GIY23_15360 [Allosaccharopolyspora coralli]
MLSPEPGIVDDSTPNASRVYDYYLGGSHNFAVDREMGDEAIALWPDLPLVMRANRAFLRRAVRYCADQGVTQFLDLGSGIPTAGNVHDVAQQSFPGARVVYVDSDPVAVAHSRRILEGNPDAAVVEADLSAPADVLESDEVTLLLNLDEPVAVMMVAVLHFVADSDDPRSIIGAYRGALCPGSFLALSHASHEGQPQQAASHEDLYRRRTTTPMTMRSRDEVTALFAGFELVEPGVVYLTQWRPESSDAAAENPERFPGLAGVGVLPS